MGTPRALRRPRRRGTQHAHQRGRHRRHAAWQTRPAGPRRPETPQPALHQQVDGTTDRRRSLRPDVRRGRRCARRRCHRSPRGGALPDDHDVVGRRQDLELDRDVAPDRASRLAGPRHTGDHRPDIDQHRRSELPRVARPSHRRHRSRPGRIPLHERAPRRDRRC